MNDWLTVVGIREGTLLASLLGALVSLKFVPGRSMWQRLTSAIGGALIAAYVSPIVTSYFTLSIKLEASVAFMVGMLGMTATAALAEEIPEFFRALRRKYTR